MRHLTLLFTALSMAGCAQFGSPGGATAQPASVADLRTTNTQAQSLQSAEILVPYSDLLTYSPNWPELSH